MSSSLDGLDKAEQSALAAIYHFEEAGPWMLAELEEEDFVTPHGKTLFRLAGQIREDQEPLSYEHLITRVSELDQKEHYGIVSFAAGIDIHLPATDAWRRVAANLRNGRQLDALRSSSMQWSEVRTPSRMPEIRDDLLALVESFGRTVIGGRRVPSLSEMLDASLEPGADAVSTGYPSLDQKINGGFRLGEIHVLAARPGMGKTALALNIAYRMAASGIPALFFSLEMTDRECTHRLLSLESLISFGRVSNLNFSDSDRRQVGLAADRLRPIPLEIHDRSLMSVAAIESHCLTRKERPWLVVVDYLGLVDVPKPSGSRHVDVGAISRRLKVMAKDGGFCVLLVAQLNREAEKRSGHRPQMSDLGESGKVEQDANTILFPFRPSYYSDLVATHGDGSDKLFDRVIVEKNRGGSTGDVLMHFDGPTMRWMELDLRSLNAQAG